MNSSYSSNQNFSSKMTSSSMDIGIWGIFLTFILPSIGGLGYLSWLVYEYIRQHYIVSFNINTTQPCYEWVALWLKTHGPLNKMQHLTLVTKRERKMWYSRLGAEQRDEERLKKLDCDWWPRPVTHYFWHHKLKKLILFKLSKNENRYERFWDSDNTGGQIKEYESLTFWTFGTSTKIWDELLFEAKSEFSKKTEEKTIIYKWAKYRNMWTILGGKPKDIRPWNTIVTQDCIKEEMLNDIKKFKDSANEYKRLGIPYRRGYLLHGPPGTGKSSLVYGLAGELKASICVLTLSDRDMSDDELMNRLAAAPRNSIILLEDIDVALPSEKRKTELDVEKRRKEQDGRYSSYTGSITMSGVLNSIDGVATADSQILIMTTNHKENLDPALIRPGRVDKEFFLDNCNASQAKKMFCNFFDDAIEDDLEKIEAFFENLDEKTPVSPAVLENFYCRFKEKSAKDVVDQIHELEEMVQSEYKLRYMGKTLVYRYSAIDRKWILFGKPRPKRPWSTIVTQDNIKDDLLRDIERFQQKQKWYHKHGIPYRCGYLLHGPPGTGKSSLAYALAGKIDYGICVLSFTDKDMTDTDLMRQLATVPSKCIVLVEDIDVALPSQKRKIENEVKEAKGNKIMKPNVTLSGVLNAIDGVESSESQIMIMTTNFKDHLDHALIRPGRIDKEFHLKNLTTKQAKHMFQNFFPSASKHLSNDVELKIEQIMVNHSISPACFENFLSRCEEGADEAVKRFDELEKNLKTERTSWDDNKTIMYRIKGHDKKWEPSGEPRGKGHWDAFVHQPETKQKLFNDVTTFLQNRHLFRTHGIPFRRTYLFHGPHGSGKMALIHSLAGKLNYSICHLSLTDKDLTVDSMVKCMGEMPRRCLLVIQNIDDLISSQKRRGDLKAMLEEQGCEMPKPKVSIMDFCNAIESFESETSPIIVMTAKNKEDIATEVFLPGRVDVSISFENCDLNRIKNMFHTAFPNADLGQTKRLQEILDKNMKKITEEDPISPVSLQRHIIQFQASFSDAIQNLNLLKGYFSDIETC